MTAVVLIGAHYTQPAWRDALLGLIGVLWLVLIVLAVRAAIARLSGR